MSDGTYRWHRVHSEPIFDQDGNLAQWLGFCVDIHDQRRAERGRGLYIVARLAKDFSVTRRSEGGSHARAVI